MNSLHSPSAMSEIAVYENAKSILKTSTELLKTSQPPDINFSLISDSLNPSQNSS